MMMMIIMMMMMIIIIIIIEVVLLRDVGFVSGWQQKVHFTDCPPCPIHSSI